MSTIIKKYKWPALLAVALVEFSALVFFLIKSYTSDSSTYFESRDFIRQLTQADANGLYLLMELADNDLLDLFLGRQKPTGTLDRPEVHQVLEAVRAQGARPGLLSTPATFSRTST